MGKINTYQRKQLASSVVGVPKQDTSGQTIGKSVVSLAASLQKRQDALDTAAVSTAYYQYRAATSLAAAEQQKQFQGDSNLDPTTFDILFQTTAAGIANKMKETMPDRLHGSFDVLVSKGNAAQSIVNTKWAFDQQNRNALLDFQELNSQSTILAGNFMNPEDFQIGRQDYLDTVEQYKPLITAKTFSSTIQKALKQQAIIYWANSIDFRNGGNPIAFANELRTNTELRETLIQDLGVKEFQRLEKNLDAVIKAAGASDAFMKLSADNKELSAKVQKLWDPSNDYGLKQVTAELETEINKRNYMANINKDGVYDGVIEQFEANIKNLHILQRIATNVNDVSYATDPRVKAELLAEIDMVMKPLGADKFDVALEGAKKDIGNQLAKQDAKIPWHHYLIPALAVRQGIREAIAEETGVPVGVKLEQAEKVKASKTLSQYIEATQTMKGRVLQAIDDKQLTFKDGLSLINKLNMLGTLEQYDLLTTQGDNWYSTGYKNFSIYVGKMNLLQGSTAENNRQFRDDIRTQMMDNYAKKVAFIEKTGQPITMEKARALIQQVKHEKDIQLHPEVMGLKKGDPFVSRITGLTLEFEGFDPETGEIVVKSRGLNKALRN